jgi:hypothetical protein
VRQQCFIFEQNNFCAKNRIGLSQKIVFNDVIQLGSRETSQTKYEPAIIPDFTGRQRSEDVGRTVHRLAGRPHCAAVCAHG